MRYLGLIALFTGIFGLTGYTGLLLSNLLEH
ncbi:hypothetical protein Hgul01_04153 [Herpetosiphon gulosus]|uniref:Uncharacterized protein n=1 Tax=Herpetosiphon gulosus TaxID=1973496 RepID=A0ABP9X717_9CHLR